MEAAGFAEQKYFEGNKSNPFWLTRQAAALTRANEYQRALDIAEKALLLQPSNPYSILAVADALFGLRRFEDAFRYYESVIKDPKVSFSAQKGLLSCLSEKKQWDRILKYLSQWEMPVGTKFQWKVKALAGQKRLDEAIETCLLWLKKDPDLPKGLWALTDLEIRRDGLEPVLQKMGRLAKIDSRPSIYKEIYASLCKKAGKPELALKQYEKLAQSGSDINILRKQAFALKKAGEMFNAIPMMEELLKLNPRDYHVHTAYVSACKQTGQLQRVLTFYNSLLASNPEEKTLYGRIRKIKNMLGETL